MRLVSILGDSVSTYEGYNPAGYSVFYDKEMQRQNGLASVYDTWWAKVNQGIGAYLCVNNSYSGSRVTGTGFPAAGSPERIYHLKTGDYSPDMILVYMGFNDFGNGIELRTFEDAYDRMLAQLHGVYSNTRILCGTLMRTRIMGNAGWVFPEKYHGVHFDDYNAIIRKICRKNRCHLADLAALSVSFETIDGSHPTKNGHRELANAWLSFLLQMDFITPTIETCIRFYHANTGNDYAVYSVFNSLLTERVLLPVNERGFALQLQQNNQTYFAVFTTQKQIPAAENISTKLVYAKKLLRLAVSQKLHVIVNPFSGGDAQFILPYPAIEKMLLPLAGQ